MSSTILFLNGSLRKDSFNARLMKVAVALLPEGYEPAFASVDLPLYNADLDTPETLPASVAALRGAIEKSAGVFWCTPEYNYGVPGVVKNAIDWASRPMIPRSSIVGKPMNAVCATLSETNGVRAVSDLKRFWNNCGGAAVAAFDTVVQGAWNKFIEVDGVETLSEPSLTTVRLSVEHLIRAIEGSTSAVALANWEAFLKSRQG